MFLLPNKVPGNNLVKKVLGNHLANKVLGNHLVNNDPGFKSAPTLMNAPTLMIMK